MLSWVFSKLITFNFNKALSHSLILFALSCLIMSIPQNPNTIKEARLTHESGRCPIQVHAQTAQKLSDGILQHLDSVWVRHGRQNTLADGLEARGKFGGRLVASAAGAWLAIEADGHGAVHEHLLVEHGDGIESGNCRLVLDDCHACLEEEKDSLKGCFLVRQEQKRLTIITW